MKRFILIEKRRPWDFKSIDNNDGYLSIKTKINICVLIRYSDGFI